MSRDIKLVLIDEVNAFFGGLTYKEISYIRDKTKIFDQAARQTAAYQLGHDDGYRTFFDTDGMFFQWMIPTVIDLLEAYGTPLDNVEVIDEREANNIDFSSIESVDDFFLMDETGFKLRPHQKEAINRAIEEKKGIIDHATSSGKSASILGISKALDGILKTIIIVPSDQLSKQTFEYYEKSELNAIRLHAGIKGKKREQAFQDYDHIIITNKLLLNCLEWVKDQPFALLIDEIHSYFGEQFAYAMRIDLANCPVRIGFTGTVPKDKLKRSTIFAHLGGEVIALHKAKTLIEDKQASTLSIRQYQTVHPEVAELSKDREWDWENERSYITANRPRIHAIAEFIKLLPKKNTLVLCHAQAGKLLSAHFDKPMIVDETPVKEREEIVGAFDTEQDALVFGSWGTIATGLSKDNIYRVVLVDVGKNQTYIKQSIGRGLRLDGVVNHVDVIDIYADTKFALKHKRDRDKIYREEHYPYEEQEYKINVEDYI